MDVARQISIVAVLVFYKRASCKMIFYSWFGRLKICQRQKIGVRNRPQCGVVFDACPLSCRRSLHGCRPDRCHHGPAAPAHLLHDPGGGLWHAVRPAHADRRVRRVPQEAHPEDPQTGGTHHRRPRGHLQAHPVSPRCSGNV